MAENLIREFMPFFFLFLGAGGESSAKLFSNAIEVPWEHRWYFHHLLASESDK